VMPAGLRAAHLIAELGGGAIADGVVDCYPSPRPPHVINLKFTEIKRLLGIDISADEASRVLTALDFKVEPVAAGLKVTTPTHRVDIQEGPADVIEELARVAGYDRMPVTLLADPLPEQLGNPELDADEHVRDLLVSYGLQEFVTYALTSPS